MNAPNQSTHNLIVDRRGNTCLVEPGRRKLFTDSQASDWYVMTNFPLSDYNEIVPCSVSGSGADRYRKTLEKLASLHKPMSVETGFDVLRSVVQTGPGWNTELSVLYDGVARTLYYCLDQRFDTIVQYNFEAQNLVYKIHAAEP